MILKFAETAWEDYLYWQTTDRKTLRRVNELIKAIQREPLAGIGSPEPLRGNWSGFWSRRINSEHRLIYAVEGNDILIAQCRYHY